MVSRLGKDWTGLVLFSDVVLGVFILVNVSQVK